MMIALYLLVQTPVNSHVVGITNDYSSPLKPDSSDSGRPNDETQFAIIYQRILWVGSRKLEAFL